MSIREEVHAFLGAHHDARRSSGCEGAEDDRRSIKNNLTSRQFEKAELN